MYKCKKCGTEFESKFCPNCGEAATEDEVMTSDEYAESTREKSIREKGIPNIWQRDVVKDKVIYAIIFAINLGIIITGIILGVKLYKKISYFGNLEPTYALLVFDEYKSEISA